MLASVIVLSDLVAGVGTALNVVVTVLLCGTITAVLHRLSLTQKVKIALAEQAVILYFEEHRLGKPVSLERDYLGFRYWRFVNALTLGTDSIYFREHIHFRAVVEREGEEKVYSCKVHRLFRKMTRVEVMVVSRSSIES